MKKLKAAQARALIGKTVPFRKMTYMGYVFSERVGTILSVSGRNVEVDLQGSKDWLWLPDYLFGDPISLETTNDR
jgi:hypothetical protein